MKIQTIIRLNAAVGASLFAWVFLLGTHDIHAQANANPPAFMTYQGFLVDGNGVALGLSGPKNYDVIFRIWPGPSGGGSLWAEQQTVIVDKGDFSVLLGEGSDIGESRPALSTLFTNSTASDRWVGLTVKGIGAGGADVDILPRLRLLTAPYAYLAQKAVTADGSAITSGTVPDARLSANVALRSGGNTFSGNQAFNNNVGIGTSSPGFPLNFASTLGNKISLYGNSGNHFGLGIQSALLQIHTDASASDIAFGYGTSSSMTERMRIKGNGNVGIGTSTPGSMLEVTGNIRAGNVGIGIAPASRLHISDTGSILARLESSSTVGSWLALGNSSTGGRYWQLISSGSGNGGGAGKLLISTGISAGSTTGNILNLQSDGHVGFNTLTPENVIHAYRATNPGIILQSSVNKFEIYNENCCDGLIFRRVGSSSWFKIQGNGSTTSSSDIRIKKDISTLANVLDRALKLRPVSYRMKEDSDSAPLQIGFVAQEVEPLFPELVTESDGIKGVAYQHFVPVAIGAIKELNEVVRKQEKALAEKSTKLNMLEQEVGELKKQMALQAAELRAKDQERDERFAALERLVRNQQPQTATVQTSSVRDGN